MLNKIFIMGRLTRDPELRTTNSGTSVASFSLAVDRNYKGADGEKETDFIDCVAWRSTAEFAAKYFTKGRMAVVEGRFQARWRYGRCQTCQRPRECVSQRLAGGR